MSNQLRVPTNPATLKRMGALDSLVQDAQEAQGEKILRKWCEDEGLDYETLSEAEKTDYLSTAWDAHDQDCFDNGPYGVGA